MRFLPVFMCVCVNFVWSRFSGYRLRVMWVMGRTACVGTGGKLESRMGTAMCTRAFTSRMFKSLGERRLELVAYLFNGIDGGCAGLLYPELAIFWYQIT